MTTATVRDLMDLTGRKALVTGYGTVGKVVCKALTELGARVAIAEILPEPTTPDGHALSVVEGSYSHWFQVDLRNDDDARRNVLAAADIMGGLDIVVHTTAYTGMSSNNVTWDEVLKLNLTSAYVIVQAARDHLLQSGHGSVILFGSIYGMVGPRPDLYHHTKTINPVSYGASKGGILQLARYLAVELAPRARANVISPGGIQTTQLRRFVRKYSKRTPMKRMGQPQDIKGAVAYLASDLSAYVTGHNLVVDGGWTVW